MTEVHNNNYNKSRAKSKDARIKKNTIIMKNSKTPKQKNQNPPTKEGPTTVTTELAAIYSYLRKLVL